jgi:hypothetical protein
MERRKTISGTVGRMTRRVVLSLQRVVNSGPRFLQLVDFPLDLTDADQLEVLFGFQPFNFRQRLFEC